MSRYIDAENIGLTNFEIFTCNGDYKEALKLLLLKIENAPSADVVERKHGKWKWVVDRDDENIYHLQCSICHGSGFDEHHNYCPNCGADMRGDEDDKG